MPLPPMCPVIPCRTQDRLAFSMPSTCRTYTWLRPGDGVVEKKTLEKYAANIA